MKIRYYKQCKLSKKTDDGDLIEISWIPEKFAKKNKYLKLKQEGKWVNGWKVISIGTKLPDSAIMDREYTEHRIETDI